MSDAIPILDDGEHDIYCSEFKIYRKSDNHIYIKEWTEYNRKKLMLYHTYNDKWYNVPFYFSDIKAKFPLDSWKTFIHTKPELHNKGIIHQNVFISSLRSNRKYWHPITGIDYEDKMLININHFASNNKECPFQQHNYKIYSRLFQTWNYLKNNKTNKDRLIEVEDESLLI